jgi:hypothetical protein
VFVKFPAKKVVSKVVNPVLVLAVMGIEIISFVKPLLQYFNFLDVAEDQVPVALLSAGLGEADGLPAHQHNLIFRSSAYPVRANRARQRFSLHQQPAHQLVFRGLPKFLGEVFEGHLINGCKGPHWESTNPYKFWWDSVEQKFLSLERFQICHVFYNEYLVF